MTYYHWLGLDAEEYHFPYDSYASVSYSNFDLDEGLPDEELTEVLFEPDFCLNKLPEECPEMIVVDGDDYGDE